MPATIGAPAIVRASYTGSGASVIEKENPAPISGIVTSVDVYNHSLINYCTFAVLEKVGANAFTSRSVFSMGALPAGFSTQPVTLPVETGDYIGAYCGPGDWERDNAGEGYWYLVGLHFPCTATNFTFYTPRTISVLGHITVPAPPTLNWATMDMAFCSTITGLKVTTITDIECHLWLRFSLVEPRRHPMQKMTRGLLVPGEIRFCFVAYTGIEQVEPADSLTHTFFIPDIPIGTQVYFYTYGTVAGYDSPSHSPIFSVLRLNPFRILIFEEWSS